MHQGHPKKSTSVNMAELKGGKQASSKMKKTMKKGKVKKDGE